MTAHRGAADLQKHRKALPSGGTPEREEQDVHRRSLEQHRRAPWLEEALAPSWRAHLAASLRGDNDTDAARSGPDTGSVIAGSVEGMLTGVTGVLISSSMDKPREIGLSHGRL